ncbi:hypothetical protein E2C01_080662 [Portunus trituberculatus]|uniref:Uncharacterized protein n=1 Tax=Portunus trituberculatus TaxID=210409 RepID=A0A5B7IU00_PORTR|nr:hypothetical protein [Portunus trituberculatus]
MRWPADRRCSSFPTGCLAQGNVQ